MERLRMLFCKKDNCMKLYIRNRVEIEKNSDMKYLIQRKIIFCFLIEILFNIFLLLHFRVPFKEKSSLLTAFKNF